MGFFDKLKNPGTLLGGIGGGLLYNTLDLGGDKQKQALDDYNAGLAGQRSAARDTQYGLLGKRQAPKISAQQEARIKALEQESTLPLEQDPQFQSQLRQATSGGAQALSSIQNKNAATGAVGGFANQGSMADVYDRVGAQLSQIAQNQNAVKDQKRGQAADFRQGIADAQIAFENAQIDAQMALEAGDAKAAQDAFSRAYAAKAQIDNASRQKILGIGQMAVGAAAGSPQLAAGGAQTLGSANQGAGPTNEAYNAQYQGVPYAQNGYAPYYQSR